MEAIAILIPCLNEEKTVGKVVADFRRELPRADIYVFDNGSDDATALIAERAGARVYRVAARGKGNVVRVMFEKVSADYFVMVDGDDTYPADRVSALLAPVVSGRCDMCVGNRRAEGDSDPFPKFHRFGNYLVTRIINLAFRSRIKDVFSGYRAFNKAIVDELPLLSKGFEVEAEMTLQALDKNFAIHEVEVPYRSRPSGSFSKLKTYFDGMLVLKTIVSIIKDYKPLYFFSIVSGTAFLLSVLLGSIVIREFLLTQKVHHPSTAVLASALMVIALLSFVAGLILDSTKRHFSENRALIKQQFNSLRHKVEPLHDPVSRFKQAP